MNVDVDILAGHLLWNHKERVVAVVIRNHRTGTRGGIDIDTIEGKGSGGGTQCPCSGLCRIAAQGVGAFVDSAANLDLRNSAGPEILAHGEVDGRQGMAEGQAGVRSYALCLILYYARAGCHQVFLVGYVGVYFEVDVGVAGMCGGRQLDF
ncbi:hypothetical protein [Segatella salivae]|uniref:hypothetical protein n=1 Tax=Segatella salivae TaxID=228604 RepID=UPI00241CB19D|nr:hypothetical protein [Segatella salivae]